MTWGSSHAQLPRAARPRWCQRGCPPRRGSWSSTRKSERHRKVLPQLPVHHIFTLSPHLLPPSSLAGDNARPRVRDESSKRLGLSGTHSILIKMSSEAQLLKVGVKGWCQILFALGRYGFYFSVRHQTNKIKSSDEISLIKRSKPHVYIKNRSACTRCNILKPWLKVCCSQGGDCIACIWVKAFHSIHYMEFLVTVN